MIAEPFPRKIAVLTTGRQDWGILRSTCQLLLGSPDFTLQLLVGGMHCSTRHGQTERLLQQEGFTAAARLPFVPDAGEASASVQAAEALRLTGEALAHLRPEAFLLVGDRFENAAAAVAATVHRLPIIHLHGGEETEGAFDNALRHAITKMSHLHLVSHPLHAQRVISMGEDPATVHIVGAPGLDNVHRRDLPDRAQLESHLGMRLEPPVVLVTLHPATLGGDPAQEAEALAGAMDAVEATYVITLPNEDPGNGAIRERLKAAATAPRRTAVDALGEQRYWGMLKIADAMLGNTSSGLIEAPAAGLPAVNIGDRQKGRVRGENVLDTPADPDALAAALRQALGPKFREQCRASRGPFGDGNSAPRILKILREWTPPDPPVKRMRSE